MKIMTAIIIGIGIWILGVFTYIFSSFLPILDNLELQGDLSLAIAFIPIVGGGAKLYFKKYANTNAILVGTIFFGIAFTLDALITVPFLLEPYDVTHSEFFLAIPFWLLMIELYAIVYLVKKFKSKS
jgi:hypothetical protein